jgi:hypothetical protein
MPEKGQAGVQVGVERSDRGGYHGSTSGSVTSPSAREAGCSRHVRASSTVLMYFGFKSYSLRPKM